MVRSSKSMPPLPRVVHSLLILGQRETARETNRPIPACVPSMWGSFRRVPVLLSRTGPSADVLSVRKIPFDEMTADWPDNIAKQRKGEETGTEQESSIETPGPTPRIVGETSGPRDALAPDHARN